MAWGFKTWTSQWETPRNHWQQYINGHKISGLQIKKREMLCHNTFTTNLKWQVIIGCF